MSQSTPRKFSEKIAIMQRKQNEDQELFSKVISEVRNITSTTNPNSPTPGSQDMMHQQGMMHQNSLSPNPMGGLVAGPPHPLLMGWNRPGGSLPNVHQMVQQGQPQMDPYVNWNYWQAPSQPHGSHARTRSPGHYHPYMQRPTKPNERIPPLENHVVPANVHLQPPDPSYSRARSDPNIHMNVVNPNYQYAQQWMPEFLSNGVHPNVHAFPMQPQHSPLPTTYGNYVNVPQQPQQSTSYQQQQQGMNASANIQIQQQQQQQGPGQEMPVGSLPNMQSPFSPQSPMSPYTGHSSGSFSGTLPGTNFMSPQSVGPYPTQQQLTTPAYLTSESQSAPTSPAAGQNVETNMQPQWPQSSRHFSASPDTQDIHIPDIHITGADGTLDCFQDLEGLRLDNDIQELLNSNNSAEQVDPACETQLLN